MSEELDRAVAVEVMGWMLGQSLPHYLSPCALTFQPSWTDENGTFKEFVDKWHPSTDMNHAALVVETEKMRGLEVYISSTSLKHLKKWKVVFFTAGIPYPNHYEYVAEDDSLPTAICHAALAAVRKGGQE